MKAGSCDIDARDYFRPVREKGHTRWECIFCSRRVARATRIAHLKGKHAGKIGYVPDSYEPLSPSETRDMWIRWHSDGMHRVDLEERVSDDLRRITSNAVEREIRRIVEE